jgi:hypothetical protein
LVEDGVAAIDDLEGDLFAELRPAVAEEARGFGERAKGVESGDGGRGRLERGQFGENFAADLVEELELDGFPAFVGAENLGLDLLEFGGDEAFRIGHRLFAMPAFRDEVEIGFRDLDKVTEDGSVADFQRLDPGFLDGLLLELSDPVLAFAGGGAEFIERREIAVAKDAAFLGQRRRLLDDGAGEEIDDVRQGVQIAVNAAGEFTRG